MEQPRSASATANNNTSNPIVSPTAVLSSTTSSNPFSSFASGSFSSLPDSASFISLEELIDCDDNDLLGSFSASASPPSSSDHSSLFNNALKPHSNPFPFTSFTAPSSVEKSSANSKPFSAFSQLQLLVKPETERVAASVLLPAAAASFSSSSSAPGSGASLFDSRLVPSVSEAASVGARSSSVPSSLVPRTPSTVTHVSSVSLLSRKRPADRSPPFSPSSSSASAFSSSLVPSFSFSPSVHSPSPAKSPVPAWSTHSSAGVAHLAAHRFDQAVYSYLLGIRSAPSHPHCRQQLVILLLDKLRLHPTAAPAESGETASSTDAAGVVSTATTAATMSASSRMAGLDLDGEVSLIESLDTEDDMQSVGSSSESEQATDWDEDEDMGIVCRPNAAERDRMLRQFQDQQLYSEQQQQHGDGQQQQQQQHERHVPDGGKIKPHAPLLDTPHQSASSASADHNNKGSAKSGDEQEHQRLLMLRMLHSYPRSLASILPPTSTSAAQTTAVTDEDEDDEEVIENKEDWEMRLAAISYLSPDLACGLCGLFLYRPVTAMCGHSFCQLCLSSFLDRQPIASLASLPCPYPKCNESLSSSRSVCVQLASALENCFPSESSVAKMHSEAISAISAGKDEDAITFLATALIQWPDTFPLYSTRLCCYLRLCQFDLAMADLKHCIQLSQPTAAKQHTAAAQPSTSSSKSLSPTLPPLHQRSAAVQSLTALGQAGLLTRFYRLAVYSFASALRLSGADESTTVDRERVAQGLIDAYLANVNAVLAELNPTTTSAATATVEEKQCEQNRGNASNRHISSRSLMPDKPAPATASTNSQPASRGSGWFATATTSTASSSRPASSTSSSSCPTLFTSSTPKPSSATSSTAHSTQSLSPSLTSFFLPSASSSTSSTPHISPLSSPARRRQDPYRLMVDHPTPSLVSSECVCLVCMELLYEPVTTVCGHTFCRLCLARSLDHKNLCPFCRVSLSVHISPTRQHVNVAIKTLLQRWCEGRYERRHARVTAALREQSSYMPLFVCTLMFPGVRCPLHIFEPRYRLMIRSVLESGYNRFGMVVHTDGEGGHGTIGCTAEIRNVRLLSDGRSLVDTVGGRRFRVVERGQRNGYNVGKVEWMDDISPAEEQRLYGSRTPSLPQLQSEVHRLVHDMLLPRLVNRFDLESQLGEMPSIAEDAARFAYWLCAVLPLPMDEKYAFLQLDSNWQRYSQLYTALRRLERRDTS